MIQDLTKSGNASSGSTVETYRRFPHKYSNENLSNLVSYRAFPPNHWAGEGWKYSVWDEQNMCARSQLLNFPSMTTKQIGIYAQAKSYDCATLSLGPIRPFGPNWAWDQWCLTSIWNILVCFGTGPIGPIRAWVL